jgi:hypothetical protein
MSIESEKKRLNDFLASRPEHCATQLRPGRHRDCGAQGSRRRLGLRMVQVEISEEIIELLEKRGYDRRDKVSIGLAVTALLSDLVLDAA